MVRNQSAHARDGKEQTVDDIPPPSPRKANGENIGNVPRDKQGRMNPSTANIYPILPNNRGFYSNQLLTNTPGWGGNVQGQMGSFVLASEYRGGNFQPYYPKRKYNIAHGRYYYPQREAIHNYPPSWTSQGTFHKPFQPTSYGQIPQGIHFKEQSQQNTYDENRVLSSKKDDQCHKRVDNHTVPFHAIENRREQIQQHEYNIHPKDTTQESDSKIQSNSCNDLHVGYVSSNSAGDPVVEKENNSLHEPIHRENTTLSSIGLRETKLSEAFFDKEIISDQENNSLKADSYEELMQLSFSFP